MELQRRSGMALWRQIQDWLEFSIKEGEMPPGSKLPTEQELAGRFGVNRHTVRRALTLLAEKELIRTEQGSGSFVREQVIDYAVGARTRFHENLLRQERKPRGELVSSGVIPATTEVARALELEKGESVIVLETLGEADGVRICLASAHFPQARFPGLDGHFRETGSVTQALRHYGVMDYRRKSTHISSRLPTAREARMLRQAKTRPVLVTESINVDPREWPIEFCETRFASERVHFIIET
ncbi:MAG: phosphonate metabolism transcriptional regulator PhnF [Desulfomicrobium sp.]|jgi:GntR family transcriptional regulator, phosphonate transport system regulatory protein|nr:phosphonate metabolism transcriptional regulator PhnF [Pseudomonadota bacterium]MBV1710680.1 phosphonate metabolism transcriptional regulator PhnF [Desulfomicrobium sp.]MBU4570288.1 phosphonate metabolism transcriptional regulator PhnF [Pseudomonadota bacterium]MBU4593208.1 phosphonate metabolism transcriptional regulator PhnF [Pseudomonadota bacterium]MBV1720308.1 phosphonate metabolism transcriptional regulator PhnF [Desulfomicrobium sp.]